jgi:hypothetical protein
MLSSTARQRATSGNRETLVAVALGLVFTFLTATHADAEPPKHKLPIPDPAAQEKVLAAIQDTYKEDYDKDKAVLAGKLIQKAKETQDATERFVLLREAKNLAAETCQSDVAFEAIDELASKYDISTATTKAEVVEQAAKIVRTIQQKRTTAKAALQVVDEAIAEENFDLGKQMVQQAEGLARLKELPAKKKELEAAAKVYADAQEAIDRLKEKPDDPEANLLAGKYLCFTKGDWPKGLPLLAKSSNAKWQSLAEKDLNGPATPAEQGRLGDAWWGTSKERAIYWYKEALPGLAGSEKDRVAKRVASGTSGLAADKVLKKIDRLVLWNEHNSNYNDDGTEVCNVALLRGGKEVWRLNNLRVPWKENADMFLAVPVPRVIADTVRVEIVRWRGVRGGLSEVQVFSGKKNIALGCRATASGEYSPHHPGATLTDGITTSFESEKGYWLLPNGRRGWAEIHLDTNSARKVAE